MSSAAIYTQLSSSLFTMLDVIFVENFMGGPTTGMALRRIFRMAGSLSWHRLQRNYISGEDGITGEGGKISPKE